VEKKDVIKVKKRDVPQALFNEFRIGELMESEKRPDGRRTTSVADLEIGSVVLIREFNTIHLCVFDTKFTSVSQASHITAHYLRVYCYDDVFGASAETINPHTPICGVVMKMLLRFWELAQEAAD